MAEAGPGPLMIDLAGPALVPVERELLCHPLVGGVILFTRNYENPGQLAALCGAIREAGGKPLLIAVDHEGGRVQRFRDGFLELPPAGTYGRQYREDKAGAQAAVRAHALATARELGSRGVDLPFTPVADLDRGGSKVIGDRAFSGSPDDAAALACIYAAALREGGMAATAKHFPGHGSVSGDSHAESPVDTRTRAEIDTGDMVPFRALIEAGVESVMMAHIQYPAVDARPASLSRAWIGGILRGELGFTGAVFCDDLSMAGAAGPGGYPDRARAALDAGCDMLPVCNARDGVIAILDDLPARVARDAARRLLALQLNR